MKRETFVGRGGLVIGHPTTPPLSQPEVEVGLVWALVWVCLALIIDATVHGRGGFVFCPRLAGGICTSRLLVVLVSFWLLLEQEEILRPVKQDF